MRISKIEVSDFRGFPGQAVYDFEFGKARNLFIYGENGSGKSSLFRAVQEFFNRNKGANPFADFKNNRDATLTNGRVSIHFDEGSSQTWPYGGDRPLAQTPSSQVSLQLGCLDYRSLLETNFTQRADAVNIFEIAVKNLVPHLEVPVGGRSIRIRELWTSVRTPRTHHASNLDASKRCVSRFNEGFQPVIAPLIDKATELLSRFPDPGFTLAAAFQPLEYHELSRSIRNKELVLSVHRDGTHVANHHNFLNEARLSAIGLVIYLSGLLISVPATSAYPKLLVLDDVLIGLDMTNRKPILEILAAYFSDWQILLLTHDRVWYEMVQVEMEGKPDWGAYEIWLAPDGVTPVHRVRASGPDFFLERARRHLADNDERAAAVYTRAAFEAKAKSYCEEKQIPIPFRADPRKIKAEAFWEKGKAHALERVRPEDKARLEAMFAAVDAAKRVILNPLSHSAPQPVTKPEIQDAIACVTNLKFKL